MSYRNKMMKTEDAIVAHLRDLIEQFKDKNPKIAELAKAYIEKTKGNNEEEDR